MKAFLPASQLAYAPLCVHGNPNVLTRDVGPSPLAQGCSGQLTVVEIERFERPLPPIKCFDPPSVQIAAISPTRAGNR